MVLTLHTLLMGEPPPNTHEDEVLIEGFMSKLVAGGRSALKSVKHQAGRLATGTQSFFKGASEKAAQYTKTAALAASKYGHKLKTAAQEAASKTSQGLKALGASGAKYTRKFGQAAQSVKEKAAEYGAKMYKGVAEGLSAAKDKTYKFVSHQASNARALATSIRNKVNIQPSAMMNKLHDHATAFASKMHLTKLFATKGNKTGLPTSAVPVVATAAAGGLAAAAATAKSKTLRSSSSSSSTQSAKESPEATQGNSTVEAPPSKPSLWKRLAPKIRKPLADTHDSLANAKQSIAKKAASKMPHDEETRHLAAHGAVQMPFKNLDDSTRHPTHSPYAVPDDEKDSKQLLRTGAVADGHTLDASNQPEVVALMKQSAKERHAVAHVENHTHHATDSLLIPSNRSTTTPKSPPSDHEGHATPTLSHEQQEKLDAEIERQATQLAQEHVNAHEDHVAARAFHTQALENGRGRFPARVPESDLPRSEPTNQPSEKAAEVTNDLPNASDAQEPTVYDSFQPDAETLRESAQPPEDADDYELEDPNAEPMPVESQAQPFDTPDQRHSLARVAAQLDADATVPHAIHAIDSHGVPIAEHHDLTGETVASSKNMSKEYAVCKTIVDRYDLERAAHAAHPDTVIHTLGATNKVAKNLLQQNNMHVYNTNYSTGDTEVAVSSPAISLLALSNLFDYQEPIVIEAVTSKHFGGRTVTLIRGDGKSLDTHGQVSHMTIKGDAHRNQIEATLFAYEPFFHPQTSGQQYVFAELSEGGLQLFQTTQCEPAVTLMIDWVLSNIILDPMLPPIKLY